MKIEDLIELLNNRLREFQLARDYAKMSGDLERMNAADKEVINLQDTLYKLNLLVDTSKSAVVRENVLSEVLTDGSVAVLGEYNITSYATDPLHERKIMNILSKMGVMDTAEKVDDYIKGKYLSSPVTGEMVMNAASAYGVDARLLMAIMEQDSSFGTAGVAVRTLNPGNVGNDDSGNTRSYESWQEGTTAVAGWLSRHRGSTTVPIDPNAVTTTTSTTTPVTDPSAQEPTPASTSTTSTTTTSTTAPVTAPSSDEPVPATTSTTSTTTTSTTTPVTDSSAEEPTPASTSTTSTTTTSTTAPVTAPSSDEPVPATTSTTSTTTTSTTTPVTDPSQQ